MAAIGAGALCLVAPPVTNAQPAGSPDRPAASGAAEAPTKRQGVQGRVTFSSGKPAEKVFVQARSLGQPAIALPDIGILTGQAGGYFWPLPPGRFELTFVHRGRKVATRQLDVGRNSPARLDVQLPQGID